MAKQGFKNIASNTFVYQEQTTSAAIGIDSNENNLLKIVAQSTAGASPTSAGGVPVVGAAGIFIDGGQSTGDITIVPADGGNLVALNVFEYTAGAANSGVMIIDEDGIIGSTLDTVDGTVLIGQTSGQPTFSATPSVTSISISNAPVNPTDGTNKAYVDAIAGGFTFIDEVRLGTVAALTAIYANGAAGVGATLTNSGTQVALSIDGVATAPGDRILVKDQAAQLQNGIYTVTSIGSGATNWVLTRATDYDEPSEISPGDIVPVTSGTINSGTTWIQTRVVTTIGTDPIVFIQFTHSDSAFLLKSANLSDVNSVSTSRTNLGLTNCATATTVHHAVQVGSATNGLTSVGVGSIGDVLIGAGGSSDPAFASLGTNSGLTNHGVVLGQGNSAFVATAVGINGQVLKGVTASDPQWGQVSLATDVTGTLPVANGGTGDATFTAFAVVAGGTTGTGALQSVSGLGTSGQVLTSNGAGALPTWQNSGGGGGGGGIIAITSYDTPGAYVFTPNANTKTIEVYGWGGGGGGSCGNDVVFSQNNLRGGGAGGVMYFKYPRSFFSSSVNVVVGAGGIGGVSETSNLTGTNGGFSSFGNLNTGYTTAGTAGGNGGYNGIIFTSTNNNVTITQAGYGGNGSIGENSAPASNFGGLAATGGGGQGSLYNNPPVNTGPAGNGGDIYAAFGSPLLIAGGIGGTNISPDGQDGNDGFSIVMGVPVTTKGFFCGGTGGGGAQEVIGTLNSNGGKGGWPGGGGGCGGAYQERRVTPRFTGTGGDGADGCVVVFEYA